MEIDIIQQNSLIVDGLTYSVPTEAWVDKALASGVNVVALCVGVNETFNDIVSKIMEPWALARRTNKVVVSLNAADMLKAKEEGKLAIVINIQNTLAIHNNLYLIEALYRLGVRIIQLSYNERNLVGDGCGEETDVGLSAFGVRVIKEMNSLGMVVDLSHVGFRTSMQAIEISNKPVIFSHSNVYNLCRNRRNIKDEQIIAVAKKGGCVGITPMGFFLRDEGPATMDDLMNHIDYIVNLVGIDHVSIGTDFVEGRREEEFASFDYNSEIVRAAFPWPQAKGFDTLKGYPNLIAALLKRYKTEEAERILGKNFIKVLAEVL